MKKCILIFAFIGLNNLVIYAQEQASSAVPELISCGEDASKSEDMARFNEEPSDSILRDAVKELQVSEPTLDTVYETYDVDKMPSFPGGAAELQKFLMENINYPPRCKEYSGCYTVAIGFVVDKYGCITSTRVLKDCDCGLAQDYLQIILSMPQWTPGEKNGKPVSVWFTLPVRIRIQ